MNGLIVGIIIGLCYHWKISLVAIAASPLMVFGSYVNAAANKGLNNAQEKNFWDANILVSDSILNYLTVASFGNDELIVNKFIKYLWGNHIKSYLKSQVIGIAVGFADFC